MIKKPFVAIAMALVFQAVALQGCTQMPTEQQGVSDLRPQIAFRAANVQQHAARVMVDGLDMGSVGAYLDGQAALRIEPGSHQLRVVLGGAVLLDEKFYLGDGVSRSFTVK